MLNEEKKKRARANRRVQGSFRAGAKVKAIYEDQDNDPAVSQSLARLVARLGICFHVQACSGHTATVPPGA
jgi:hypothetical protein